METEDIPPTTLNPAPVIDACEIVTAVVPVLVSVRVCELFEPVVTFPKLKLVALAASVPVVDAAASALLLAAGLPAPVKPVHPEMERAVKRTRIVMGKVSGFL